MAPVWGNDEGGMMNDELGIKNVFVCMRGMLNYIELSGLQVGNDEGGMMNGELGIKIVFVCMQGMLNYKELSGLQVRILG
ncbi:MAG TPA: hypothetical protein VIX80_08015 [Candidatus Kapabacteria bacterium]